jgi:hypothetical protein
VKEWEKELQIYTLNPAPPRKRMSHTVTSRDFVCQSPNQKPQIFLRFCSLGADRPQSPEKKNERRNNVYERYTNRRACHGKRKR